ncbi:MAG: hypothetical protein WB511_02610 [Nitrososphaeraceae archaeon]
MDSPAFDWIDLVVKFSGVCKTCGKVLRKGERAVWSKNSKAIKHIECHLNDVRKSPNMMGIRLKCIVCGNDAGCLECEFEACCNRKKISNLCICKYCYSNSHALDLYDQAASRIMFGK